MDELEDEKRAEPTPVNKIDELIEIPIQINGKLKSKVTVSSDCSSRQLIEAALSDPKISSIIAKNEIKKEIVIDGTLVNFVI